MAAVSSYQYHNRDYSVDIWDRKINLLSSDIHKWNGIADYPILPIFVWKYVQRGQRRFHHINYPNLAMELIYQGEMEFSSEQGTEIATPGSLYVIAPNSDCCFEARHDNIIKRLTLLVMGNCLHSISHALHLDQNRLIKVNDFDGLSQQIMALGEMLDQKCPIEEISAATYAILLRVSHDISPEPEMLSPMLKVIRADASQHYSLAQLAKLCGISTTTLQRKFKEYFKISPYCYLLRLRLNLARELLRNETMSIKSIALRCGFSSTVIMDAAFKKYYHETPSECRRQAELKQL